MTLLRSSRGVLLDDLEADRTARGSKYDLNWGKSSPAKRGMVEFVSVRLPRSHDLTLYLGDPYTNVPVPGYIVTVGNGATSFEIVLGDVYHMDMCIRGAVLHVVADQVVVRGDTGEVDPEAIRRRLRKNAGDPIPRMLEHELPRFAAQCGIGRPVSYDRIQGANAGDSWKLSPFSTHAWFQIGIFETPEAIPRPPEPGELKVVQTISWMEDGESIESDIGEVDATQWTQPVPLDPWANGIKIQRADDSAPGYSSNLYERITM